MSELIDISIGHILIQVYCYFLLSGVKGLSVCEDVPMI